MYYESKDISDLRKILHFFSHMFYLHILTIKKYFIWIDLVIVKLNIHLFPIHKLHQENNHYRQLLLWCCCGSRLGTFLTAAIYVFMQNFWLLLWEFNVVLDLFLKFLSLFFFFQNRRAVVLRISSGIITFPCKTLVPDFL